MYYICVALFFFLSQFQLNQAINYKLTTFIERPPFSNSSSTYETYTLYHSKNFTVQATYIYIQGSQSLTMIQSKLHHINQGSLINSIDVYSTMTSAKISAILENSVPRDKSFYPLKMEGCLKKPEDLTLLLQNCTGFEVVYVESIKSLLKNLFLWPVAIIAGRDQCERKFLKILAKELEQTAFLNNPYSDDSSTVFTYELGNSPKHEREVRNVIYDLKLKSVSMIILLCKGDISQLLFKVASKFSVLRFKKVWLMIDSSMEIDNSIAPSQLIAIKHDPASVLFKSSFLAKKKFVDVLNLLLVAEDAKKRGIITQSDLSSLRNLAKKEVMTRSCETYNSARTALVSLRKSHFNWIPLYRLKEHGNLILLSHDAEFLRISRSKLQGITLRIVTAFESPFIVQFHAFYVKDQRICQNGVLCRVPVISSKGTVWNETCCIGYLIDLIKKLQSDLWFQTYLYLVEDGFYGASTNGTWNGIVADLVEKKADLSIAAITNTKERSTVVDFSEPFLQVALSILMLSKQEKKLPFINFAFLAHLSEQLLWSILGVFIAGMALVFVLENQSRYNEERRKKFQNYPLKECFTYFSGLTFQRDLGGHNPKQIAARITAITFAFAMVVVMTTYTAMLTATKVQQAEADPFRGLSDRRMTHPTTDFKFACLANSSTSAYFKRSANPTYRNMHLFMKNYNTKSNEKGVKDLFSGQLQAFITEDPMAHFYASKQRDCGLKILKTDKGKSTWAIAFQKGWSWSYLVSQKVLQYKENGFFADLNQKWMVSACSSVTNSTTSPSSVQFEYFGGLIIVLVGFTCLSVFLLLVENACNRYRKRIAEPVKETIAVWREQREQRRNSVQIISFRPRSDSSVDSSSHRK